MVPANEQESVFHLSSAMCAQHRFDLLGDDRQPQCGTIRYRLRHRQACRLVSTQLVEAGVDMDFPLVYRALAPLDAIVQAAGRCNREGRLMHDNGQPGLGEVVIFTPEDGSLPPGVYRKATDITTTLLARSSGETLAHNHELFADYFNQLYQLTETDRDAIQADRAQLKYRDVAEKARVIEDDTRSVIVLYGRAEEIVSEIRSRQVGTGQPRLTRDDVRRLQRYMVSVHVQQFQQLEALAQIKPLLPNLDLYVLSAGIYHEHLGLVLHQRPLEDFIV
jgi:CRISPR-associated endonuclease/helicase Cas3